MKVFTDNCDSLIEFLPEWESLTSTARKFFATHIPTNLRIPDQFHNNESVRELRNAGFITGNIPKLKNNMRPFLRAIRAMYKTRHIFNKQNVPDMLAYMQLHLSNHESKSITTGYNYNNKHWKNLNNQITDEGWITGFTTSTSGESWESRTSSYNEGLMQSDITKILKEWIAFCTNNENPVAIESLPKFNTNIKATSNTLNAAIRYLLLFPALSFDTFDIVIGIIPAVHKRLNKTDTPMPESIKTPPPNTIIFNYPWLMHDMITVLVNSTPDGFKLRATGGLFKRESDRLSELLQPLLEYPELYDSNKYRLNETWNWLISLKMLATKGKSHKNSISLTKKGREWLEKNSSERLKVLIDELKKTYKKQTDNYYEWNSPLIKFTTSEINYGRYDYNQKINYQHHLINVFKDCETDSWIPLNAFLDWCADEANPLLNQTIEDSYYHVAIPVTVPEKEEKWKKFIKDFITERLLPLGCAKTYVTNSEEIWFSITTTGKYLLGFTPEFKYSIAENASKILVQSNFEVIFTNSAPSVESIIGEYAKRIGHGVGTLFRITRESIHAALERSNNNDNILERLNQHISKPLPQNVSTQIKDWIRSYRRVAIKRLIIIRCPDKETALNIQALFPRLVQPITETLLEITNQKSLTDIKKKLKKNGIGIE